MCSYIYVSILIGATGQRAKEGGKINQSLLSLSRVIHALSQPGMYICMSLRMFVYMHT
jgi:hypothetical protein